MYPCWPPPWQRYSHTSTLTHIHTHTYPHADTKTMSHHSLSYVLQGISFHWLFRHTGVYDHEVTVSMATHLCWIRLGQPISHAFVLPWFLSEIISRWYWMEPPITLMMGIPTSQTIFPSSPASYTCFSPISRLLVVIMLWPPASLPENDVSRPPTSQMNFKSPPASLSRF